MTVSTKSTDVTGDPGFKSPLKVELGDNGLWILTSDLLWRGSDGDLLIVKAGEETDFASVPRFAQALLPSADNRVIRAAVVHDFLCRELNDYHRAVEEYLDQLYSDMPVRDIRPVPTKPAFSSVDADAIFKKIMADEGAGVWMRNVGWVGVRLGAAANPARREGWASTLWPVLWRSTAFLCLALAILAVICLIVPW